MKIDFFWFVVFVFFSFINAFFIHDVPAIEGVAFFLIAFFSSVIIFLHPSGVATLLKLFFLFIYIFFGVVPVAELDSGRVYWGGEQFESGQYLLAAVLIIILNGVVYFSYVIANKKTFRRPKNIFSMHKISLSYSRMVLIIGISILLFWFVLNQNNFNIYSFLFRGGELVDRTSFQGSHLNLIYSSVVKFLPMAIALIVIFKVRGSLFLKALLLSIGVVCVFPTSIARLRVPTYYFPIMFVMLPFLLKKNNLVIVISVSLLTIFPFLDNFRRFSDETALSFSIDYSFLLAGHFDAFQNFVRIVHIDFISYGNQLLGAILFWIPRSLWTQKPIGTGHQLAEEAGYEFSNISATWYAEGWANFGFPGAFLFAMLIGFFMGKFDKYFWEGRFNDFYKIVYLVFLGYIFFLLRGDLLSGFAYLIGTIVALALSYFLVTRNFRDVFHISHSSHLR